MIKNKGLILSLIFIILNFPVQSFAYSLNNFQQMATLNEESNVSSGGNSNINEPGNNSVELDGAIGAWEPGNDELPNFDNIDDADIDGNKPDASPEQGVEEGMENLLLHDVNRK